jgi:ABC-type multidrug transport system fused ATPase/permease subunit
MSANKVQGSAKEANTRSSIQILAGETFVYLTLVVLVWGTWRISQLGLFASGDDMGYWIGVIGAVMMLVLLLYPLRKYFRFAHGWGNIRFWFWAHVLLGIFGPLLILLHSNFRTGSLNAAVALYSMIVVALSGVAGRFIFQRVNRGLLGEQTELSTLKGHVGMDREDVRSRLAFAPQVEERLRAFELSEMQLRDGPYAKARAVFWLPVLQYLTYRRCAKDLDAQLRTMATNQHWSKEDLKRRRHRAKRVVDHYLNSVVGVAQFSAYSFLFSLWHVAHIPFVYVLILTALVHVYAVHIY